MLKQQASPCEDCGQPVGASFLRYCDADLERRYQASLTPAEAAAVAYLRQPLAAVAPEPEKRPGENRPVDPVRKAREAEALDYAANYVGTWGLPKDIRADRRFGTKYMTLSDRQIDVLLEGKARDLARAKERKQTGRDLRVLPYGRTHAAVDNDEGGVTFFVFDRPEELDRFKNPNRWHGWVFVRQHLGGHSDFNDPKVGSQRPGESYVGQWPTLIDRVLADPMAAVVRYGTELGICGVCERDLTNEDSRAAGIGPVCAKRMREAEAAFGA